jgi:uncharacterized repeat protein (TIGR04042 family)
MQFVVRWPDDSVMSCYSPSLIVREYLAVDGAYPVPDFVSRCREALNIASDRVRAKYGFPCGNAADQLERIVAKAGAFESQPGALVRVERFVP